MTGSVPVDWQLTDTYFVVAHIHYVLIGINLFPVIGGIYFWFPKMTGRMMDERLGSWSFWIIFSASISRSFPMHITGLMGMPRRVYTYPAGLGWDTLNLITTIGSFVLAIGILIFLINIVVSLRRGAIAGPNPWDAPTLEWSVPSPPPPYNFAVIPIVASREPLWEDRLREHEDRSSLESGLVLDHGREVVATTPLDAEADVILKMPGDTLLPLLLALALVAVLTALLAHLWWVAVACGVLERRIHSPLAMAKTLARPDRGAAPCLKHSGKVESCRSAASAREAMAGGRCFSLSSPKAHFSPISCLPITISRFSPTLRIGPPAVRRACTSRCPTRLS